MGRTASQVYYQRRHSTWLGRAVADGLVDLDKRVGTFLPETGTACAESTIKAVAYMNVANEFIEDYSEGGASDSFAAS
ncbi:hypothetical protein EN795_33405 [bacterium M00.F.Ca.ET.152.01.1.1]|nr:hypothetical protein EN795_33405 [bacterium M00.F.Ca.ET.152.01.1.1]